MIPGGRLRCKGTNPTAPLVAGRIGRVESQSTGRSVGWSVGGLAGFAQGGGPVSMFLIQAIGYSPGRVTE